MNYFETIKYKFNLKILWIVLIEYVVFHELTHLIYNAHNKYFYDFLTSYIPDWKERKKRLDTEIVQGL